jgi:hypothetical protein
VRAKNDVLADMVKDITKMMAYSALLQTYAAEQSRPSPFSF